MKKNFTYNEDVLTKKSPKDFNAGEVLATYKGKKVDVVLVTDGDEEDFVIVVNDKDGDWTGWEDRFEEGIWDTEDELLNSLKEAEVEYNDDFYDGDLIGYSKDGQKVRIEMVEDCAENEGGYWCQVYFWDDEEEEFFEDYDDDFCIHPDDCDCSNNDEVEKYALDYISNIDYSL